MKVMIATHGYLADGVKNNLSLFVDTSDVETINAYVNNDDYIDQIKKFIDEAKEDEIRIIFTDIIGGSVNQIVSTLNYKVNVKVISGFNIALILEIMLSKIENDEQLEKIVEKAREQMQLVKLNKKIEDESDDDFLS